MRGTRFAFFLTAVALCWLLPEPNVKVQAAGNAPLTIQRCASAADNTGIVTTTLTCVLTNTGAGHKIEVFAAGSGSTITFTTTESVTCPAAATLHHAYITDRVISQCYVDTASSHAVFSISVTVSGGGLDQADQLVAKEIQGLASGADVAGSAAASSFTLTTGATNEQIDSFCADYVSDLVPGSGFAQDEWVTDSQEGTTEYKGMTQHQITTTAAGYTTACTFTGTGVGPLITGIAFAQSSPPAIPSIRIVQSCYINTTGTQLSDICALHNTTSGNKIVAGLIYGDTGTSPLPIADNSSTEATTCPTNAQVNRPVGGVANYAIGVCYVDTASSHALFLVATHGTSGTHPISAFQWTFEVAGLNSGIDAGSETAVTAITTSYTTAASNEYTFFFAGDTSSSTMSPGNSFIQAVGGTTATAAHFNQGLSASKTTTSSGSNTASFTLTGTTEPLLATVSFGEPVPAFKGYPMVIRYRPNDGARVRKIPWDRPRKQILLETI